METFITSDLHFDHNNVIEYSNRPFSSKEEMKEKLLLEIQSLPNGSNLYHLGDFFFGNKTKLFELLSSLKKSINYYFILGNHDKSTLGKYKTDILATFPHIKEIEYYKEITIRMDNTKKSIVLFHYPLHAFNRCHYDNVYHLFGHAHGRCNMVINPDPKCPWHLKCKDVGIDCTNYKILTVESHIKDLDEKLVTKKEVTSQKNS